jgi:hypothetical protein
MSTRSPALVDPLVVASNEVLGTIYLKDIEGGL